MTDALVTVRALWSSSPLIGIGIRCSVTAAGRLNGYAFIYDGSDYSLVRYTNSSPLTSVLSMSPPSDGIPVTLEAVGSTIRVLVEGVEAGSITDTTYADGNPAVLALDINGTFSLFEHSPI
ncbi:MAG: hypothetical protein SFZ24_10205 [Planctomycetota bacterium]|nr:hypothetical protein [Planctomycetota bacterium]